MGNRVSLEGEEDKEQSGKKSKAQEKVQIVPYIDGMPVLQSKLQKLIKKTHADQKELNNEVIVMKEKKENIKDIQEEIFFLEHHKFPNMSDHIRSEYQRFSSENKMGQRKLLEYFGLTDLEKHRLGTRIFLTCKNTLSQEKTGPYLDYSKFLKTLALLSGKYEEGRLEFLYQIFDLNLDGKIEKDEMKDTLQMILEALLTVNYEDEDLRVLAKRIQGEQERMINISLDHITNEIFETSNQTSSINFSQWKEWIQKMDGFDQVITFDNKIPNFTHQLPNQNQSKQYL